MQLLKLAFRREIAMPMLALMLSSAVCMALAFARIIHTGNIHYGFLIWNLVLAWLPLIFALLASDSFQNRASRNWRFYCLAGAWLLFFPNAPYIFTDVIHLTASFYAHFWVDMVLVLLCAFTGFVLGFVSLYLMQTVVTRMFGRAASWGFIAVVAALCGVGIYLGRFLRFNSWDIFFKPVALYRGVGHWVSNPVSQPTSLAFPVLFAAFLFIAYLMLYALTHLRQAPQVVPFQKSAMFT